MIAMAHAPRARNTQPPRPPESVLFLAMRLAVALLAIAAALDCARAHGHGPAHGEPGHVHGHKCIHDKIAKKEYPAPQVYVNHPWAESAPDSLELNSTHFASGRHQLRRASAASFRTIRISLQDQKIDSDAGQMCSSAGQSYTYTDGGSRRAHTEARLALRLCPCPHESCSLAR